MKKILRTILMMTAFMAVMILGSISQGAKVKAVDYAERCSYKNIDDTASFTGMNRIYELYNYRYYWQGEFFYINFWGNENCDSISGHIYKPNGDKEDLKPSYFCRGTFWDVDTTGWEPGKYRYELTPTYSGKQETINGYFCVLQSPSDAAVFEGNDVIFSTGLPQYYGVSYQWYYSYSKTGTDGVLIQNADQYTYTVPAKEVSANRGKYYFCKIMQSAVKNGAGGSLLASKVYSSYSAHAKLEVKYSISYHANGGTGAPDAQTKKHDSSVALSEQRPVREGYEFKGWSTDNMALTPEYSAGDKYSANQSIKLYAVWERIIYTITYNANGGVGAPDTQTKNYNESVFISSIKPTKEGYEFIGWSVDNADYPVYKPGEVYFLNENLSLTAVWGRITYTISYDANGGTGAPSEQIKNHGEAIQISDKVPEREGYEFTGWVADYGYAPLYQPGDSYNIDDDLVLTAKWARKEYLITYDANGGIGAPSQQTKYHNYILILSDQEPEREGYAFKGWSTDVYAAGAKYPPGDIYTENKEVTLYAVWERIFTTPTPGPVPTPDPTSAPLITQTPSPEPIVTWKPIPTPDQDDDEDDEYEDDDEEDDTWEDTKETAYIDVKNVWNKTLGAKRFSLRAETNSDAALKYQSLNTSVAVVNKNGIVTVKKCGMAKIYIRTGSTDEYTSGLVTTKVIVTPKKAVILKLTSPKNGQIKCKIKKQSGITGYDVYISTQSGKHRIRTIKKLTYHARYAPKAKYKVKIRAYKMVYGKKYAGAWSKTKTIRTK